MDDLISFCFPADLMLRPLENVDLIRNHCILSPLRATVAQLNDRIRNLIPESYSQTEVLHALDHRVHAPAADDPTALNAAQRDIEYIHNRTPSGFPPYELRLKVGMICVMICNYDPQAHLFNGTRVQILQIQRNLLKVKVLTGTGGHVAYIGRKKFEYGRKRTEPGISFTRTQYPLEPGFCLTINKSQGQTLDRVGVDLTARQCFSHGMLYTAMSRVRSASSLRILSGLRDKAVNVVDPELIRDADVDLIASADNENARPTAPSYGLAPGTRIPPNTDAFNPTIPPPTADSNRPPSEHGSELEDDVFIDDT
jgi:ATP-dependent exoDNAse (exonuclease V) alpha subunit